ncbi:MAG: hypothetical protein HY898_20810 [Deltaproteobacteria bacterium]|nr:hypothetical protein [Deltaproteobacteria bacterium]
MSDVIDPAHLGADRGLEALLRSVPNPFAEHAVRSAHDPLGVDVPTLHLDAFRAVRELIERVRGEGKPRIQVVLGDPGEGKTHLLCRLRRMAEDSWRTELPYALAAIAPLREPLRPFGHILREASASLALPLHYIDPYGEQPASQLERLGWLALAGAVDHLRMREGRFQDWGAERVPRFLASFVERALAEWPKVGPLVVERGRAWAELQRIDPEVWRVLGLLPLEQSRPIVLGWLKGASLSERERIDRDLPMSVEGEDRAFRVLMSLANCPDTPLVLGFDQIEGVRRLGVDVVRQFFSALVDLFNQRGRLAMLVLCQTSLWPDIRDGLEQQVRERLEPPIRLRGLIPQEAVALATARLLPVWTSAGVQPPFPTWPMSTQEITEQVAMHGYRTPRRILMWMAERIGTELPPAPEVPTPLDLFAQLLVRERATLFDRTLETRSSIARNALHLALDSMARTETPGWGLNVVEVKTKALRAEGECATVVTVDRAGVRRRAHIEASNSSHGGSVKALVQRLARAVASKQASVALLLREQSSPLPSAAATLVDSAPQVVVVWLTGEEMAALAAVEALSHACGDAEMTEPEAMQQCARAGAALDVLARIGQAIFEPKPQPGESIDPDVVRRIEELLSSKRTVIREGRLADMLGVDRDQVAAALDHLAERGAIGLTTDTLHRRVAFRRGS